MFSISSRKLILAFSLLLVASMVLMPGFAGKHSPVKLTGSIVSADAATPRSYSEFIRGAYVGTLGRLPTCFEEQSEFDALVDASASGTLLAEARRFVSTLFETQASFDNPDPNAYCQTSAYEAINPAYCNPFVGTASDVFITDLYEGFLLREPEQAGFDAWMNTIPTYGRKVVLNGFRDSTEFSIIVANLYEGTRRCCITHCPSGYVLDPDACECVPDGFCRFCLQ